MPQPDAVRVLWRCWLAAAWKSFALVRSHYCLLTTRYDVLIASVAIVIRQTFKSGNVKVASLCHHAPIPGITKHSNP